MLRHDPFIHDYGIDWCAIWERWFYMIAWYRYDDGEGEHFKTLVIKYYTETEEFSRVISLDEPVFGFFIIGDKAILLRNCFPNDDIITVMDLKNEKILAEDVDISQHD